MQLTTASGLVIERPASVEIEKEIRALPGGDDSFLILSRDEMTYVQVAGGGTDPFTLEYQNGSLDHHYRAVDPPSLEAVIAVFVAYGKYGDSWKRLVEWEQEDLSSFSTKSGTGIVSLMVIAVVASIAFYWLWQAG